MVTSLSIDSFCINFFYLPKHSFFFFSKENHFPFSDLPFAAKGLCFPTYLMKLFIDLNLTFPSLHSRAIIYVKRYTAVFDFSF